MSCQHRQPGPHPGICFSAFSNIISIRVEDEQISALMGYLLFTFTWAACLWSVWLMVQSQIAGTEPGEFLDSLVWPVQPG